MKSVRNRGQAFEKRRGSLREQCALAGTACVCTYTCAPVAAIADDQRDARSRKAGGEIHRTIKTIGRRYAREGGRKGNASSL